MKVNFKLFQIFHKISKLFLVGLYVKVTLFESMKVVKAKKTGSIKIIDGEGEFKETFSILFPQSFMDKVKLKYYVRM